jgi:hypothetical protein
VASPGKGSRAVAVLMVLLILVLAGGSQIHSSRPKRLGSTSHAPGRHGLLFDVLGVLKSTRYERPAWPKTSGGDAGVDSSRVPVISVDVTFVRALVLLVFAGHSGTAGGRVCPTRLLADPNACIASDIGLGGRGGD